MSELQIPDELKYLKGIRFDPLIRLEFNNIQLEEVLPGLFYVTRLGRRRGKGEWGTRIAAELAKELSSRSDKFIGFDNDKHVQILEEWLKSSILRLKDLGASEKVLGIRPLHYMTYRVDLPTRWAALLSVPEFLAAILHQDPSSEPLGGKDEPFVLQSPDNLWIKAFGNGMKNKGAHYTNAEQDYFDDATELDIESLLAVRIAEGLKPPREVTVKSGGKGGIIPGFEPLCPAQARIFRQDFSSFLRAYSGHAIPVRVLGDYVVCLLSLNLTTYMLCHLRSANHLYLTGDWLDDRYGPDKQRRWELGIYADLTGGRNRKSRELARQSYARNQEVINQHLRTVIGFRLLEYYLRPRTDIKAVRDLRTLKGVEFLKLLAQARQSTQTELFQAVQAGAGLALAGLERAQPDEQWPNDVMSLVNDYSLSPFDKLIELLASTQKDPRDQFLKFFNDCSRRNLESGLLAGTPRTATGNYYTLGVQMLETLVQLLVLDRHDPSTTIPLDIYDFVELLKVRYGIWVDKPPPGLDQSFEAKQAAQANMDALKEKLRQLGFFRAVTDARRMQRLRPRYLPISEQIGANV